jgi:hypothetical protein
METGRQQMLAPRHNLPMNRRTFLGVAAGLTLADAGAQTRSSIPVIDTHIHLYDPSRPQGVPWPNKENKVLYQTSLPPRYRQIVEPLGIVGAIEVEQIPVDVEFYRPRLDEVLDVFGIDRVLYGSDWPNGDQWLPVPVGFKIVQEFFMGKGQVRPLPRAAVAHQADFVVHGAQPGQLLPQPPACRAPRPRGRGVAANRPLRER